jgi:hypothetical protein
MTETHVIHGIPVLVANTRPDIETPRVLAQLRAALDLIARYQPWRFRRLRRDVAQLWVRRYPCRGAYFPQARACLVELTFLANPEFSPAQVAASIVHEATHARVDRMGVRDRERLRSREERLCRKAELELGLAVPGGEPVVERALWAMQLEDEEVAPEIDWAEASRRVADVDRQTLGGG